MLKLTLFCVLLGSVCLTVVSSQQLASFLAQPFFDNPPDPPAPEGPQQQQQGPPPPPPPRPQYDEDESLEDDTSASAEDEVPSREEFNRPPQPPPKFEEGPREEEAARRPPPPPLPRQNPNGPPPPGPPPDYEDDDDSQEDDSSEERICPSGKYYDETTDECYTSGKKGPCPETMTFRKDPKAGVGADGEKYGKNEVGRCDCAQKPVKNKCTRPMIYSESFNRCYYIFSQGPCEYGQWYVPELEVTDFRFPEVGKCKRIPCMENITEIYTGDSSSGVFVYALTGRCYKTFSRGHCGESDFVAHFQRNGETAPICVPEGWFHKYDPTCSRVRRQEQHRLQSLIGQEENINVHNLPLEFHNVSGTTKPTPDPNLLLNLKLSYDKDGNKIVIAPTTTTSV